MKDTTKKRILFITLTNIGDVVTSTVLIRRILKTYPDAIFDIVVGDKSKDLFSAMPNLGKLIPVIKEKYHRHHNTIWKKVRKNNYDIVIDLRSPLLGRILKAPHKIIFKPHNKFHKGRQMAELWKLPKADDIIKQQSWITPEAKKEVASKLSQLNIKAKSKDSKSKGTNNKKIIALAPTANWIGKCWSQKNFSILVKELIKLHPNAMFLVLGAKHERESITDLLNSIPKDKLIDKVGDTSLQTALAWLDECSLFIGNDSGLAHMAASLDCQTAVFFGPTNEKIYAPISEKGVIINPGKKRKLFEINLSPKAVPRLITDITVKDALDKIKNIKIGN